MHDKIDIEKIDVDDPEWAEGRPWYAFDGGENRIYDDSRFQFRGGMTPADCGVKQEIAKAAEARKAAYVQMAREAIDAVETREAKPVEVEPVEVPRVEVREPAPKPEGRAIAVNAPVEDHMNTRTAPKPEFDKPMARDASFADLLEVPESDRGLNLGKHLRGMLTGNWRGAEAEQAYQVRAMSGATAGAGGSLLPVVYSAQVIDLARAQTVALKAGAQIVPMSARQIVMPKWTADPTVSFRSENGAVATSDGTVDKITFTAQSLAGYTTISREIIEDTDLSDMLANAYAKAVSLAWDKVVFTGTGVAPQPLGLLANTGITDKAAVVTNGATVTYDHLIDGVGSVLSRNEHVGAIVYHPRNELALAKSKEATTNAYLKPPAYLDGIPRLQCAQLPTNETEGTSGAVCNSMVIGDFSQCFIGIRTNFGIDVHTSPAATTGQVLMVAWMRLDVQVGRPGAFALRTGLKA